jgi:hypothetical protein
MIRSRRILTSLGFAALLATTLPACVVTARGHARVRSGGAVVITEAPPPPQEERIEVRSGYVWIRGRWDWRGGQWVWMPGHWERERSGHAWREGRWEQRNNQWVWVDGEWTVVSGDRGTAVVHDTTPAHVTPPPPPDRPAVRDHRAGAGARADVTVVVDDGRPRQPPPALRAENPGSKAGYIWVSGHWDWRGGQWEWIPGHWERSRAKKKWRDGRWELRGDAYIWVDGGWDDDDTRPRVRDHR